MTQYRPLFVTSTARSGAGLISMMLSAHNNVMVALDPFLEVFRSLRNAIVRHDAPVGARESFDQSAPLQDYYFTDERIKLMDTVQQGDLSIPFDGQEWDGFLERGRQRCALECPDLAQHFGDIRGETYKGMIENGLRVIAKTRNADKGKWVGFKDCWTVEFLRPLATAFPEARFIIIRRDPRAFLNSNLGGVKSDPLGVAETLSYLRHWRKYVAFSVHYQNDPLFADRLFDVTHEQVLREPEKKARELCEFLEIDYEPDMLDTNTYFDFATGTPWSGNSTFEKTTTGIDPHVAERWRTMLDARVGKMIEFTCGYDMRLMGDGPFNYFDGNGGWPSADILEFIIESGQGSWNWRSDLGDPQQDYGFELFRRALLDMREPPRDHMLVRRSFLFEEVYEKLRQVAATRSGTLPS